MADDRREIVVLTDLSLITCIVQRGAANAIVRAAIAAGAHGATVHYAEGSGMRERLGILGFAIEVEKEVVQIVVASEQSERIFEAMYLAGKLDTPGMGFIFVTPLEKGATFVPQSTLDRILRREKRDSHGND